MKHKREKSKYDAKNCGRQATVFLRVRYKELYGRHDNGKYEDVFGFCDECARNKNSPMSWNGDRWGSGRKVLGVRGVVASASNPPRPTNASTRGWTSGCMTASASSCAS